MLRMKAKLEDPKPPGRFLGSFLRPFGSTAHQMKWTLAVGHRAIRSYVYHVEEYMRECVDLYCSLLGISKNRLKRGVKTLFPDRPKETSMLGGRGDRRLHRLDGD